MQNMIKIYDVVTNVEKYSALFEEGSKRGFMLMTDDYIELIFKTRKQKHFALGDYIVHEKYGRFEITEVQQPKFNSDLHVYEYTLRFNAEYFKWKNKKYKFEPSKGRYEASFSLTDKMDRHMSILIANLAYYGWEYTWNYEGGGDASVVNANKYLTFDNVSIFDALTKIADAFEVEWWVSDNIIHLGRCEIGYTGSVATFEVGKNVAEITGNNSEKEYFNVFTAFGSDRNLPTNYRKSDEQLIVNGVVQKRLMLPKETPLIYLDGVTKDSPTSQKVEGIVVFDDIYPKTGGEIASVTSFEENVDVTDPTTGEEKTEKAIFYRFKDKTLKFDESYILPGQTLQVVFSSGKLNGMTFDVEFNPLGKSKTDPDYQTFEIVRNESYGIPLPSESYGPKVGDKYTLVGFDATKIGDMGLITSAETELKARAEEYAKKLQIDPNNYTCTMLADYMYGRNAKGELDKNFAKTFELGAVVNLKDNNLFATGSRQSRVIGFEYRLDEPFNNAIITVGENATYSRSSAMEGEINAKLEEISFGGVNFGGNTGGGGTSIYIITSTSETAETDKNVYSALRTKENFANKKANDSISALWSFAQSSSKRGIQTHHYTNEGNEDNLFGKGFELIQKTTEQGNSVSRLEVDELLVRMRAVFASLEIRQMSYVGGNFVFSAAGSKLYHVVSSGAVWRCYLYSDDGTTATANNWKVNDQALCQTFDIDEGVHKDVKNKRYWRRVVSVGKEMISGKTKADGTPDTTQYQYVDLSKADCEYGSATPEFGDTIVQFGNWTDKERQGIIYIMVVGEYAPAIIEYSNVGDEHFVWPEVDTQISPRGGNIFKGKFYSVVEGSKNPITIEDQIRNIISDFEELKNQADKKMEIWFKEGIPYPLQGMTHIPTEPANEWTTDDLKELHVGDLYYDTLKQPGSSGGRAYRWTKNEGEYYWVEVTDQDTIAALEKIADVASDGVLSAGAEKTRVLIDWREAVEAYLKYSEQALDYVASVEKYKVPFDIITPYESFREAFNDLAYMMNDGEDYNLDEMPTPIFLQDINTSTKIDADTYRLRWSNWYESVVSILNAISGAAQALANNAQVSADHAQETADKRSALAQFANVYQKRYGSLLKVATSQKVYISTKEQLLPDIALENEINTISSMRDLYLATNKLVGVTYADDGWSDTVPLLDDRKMYLWHIVEATTENRGMMIYGKPRLLHTFKGRDKIVKVKPYYQTIAKYFSPATWSETPVIPGGSKPCLWMKFDIQCMEDDTYSTELGGIKFDGDTAYICTSDESRWSRPTMITDENDSLFATLNTIQETFGGITITLYSMPQETAKDHDLAIRIISYTDTFKKETKEGPCEILMYYDGKWELLQESVTAMIENLGDELRLIVFGADGKNTVDTSGLVTQTKFNELFSKKVTLDANGKVTNIDKSGLLTSADFATLFSEALEADGTVVKKSEITAFITKDEKGYMQSGVKIKADAIEITGTDSISLMLNGVKSGLKNTGIDIQKGTITLNADNTTINGNLSLRDPNQGIIIYDQYGNTKVSVRNSTIGTLENYDLGGDMNIRKNVLKNRTSTSQKISASFAISLGNFSAGQSLKLYNTTLRCKKRDMPFDTNISSITYSYNIKCGSNEITTKSGSATRKTEGFDFDGFLVPDYANSAVAYTGEYILNISCEVTLASSSSSLLGEFLVDVNALCRKVMAGIIQISTDGAMLASSNVNYNWFGSDKTQLRNGAAAIRLKDGRLQRNESHGEDNYWSDKFADISTLIPTEIVNGLTYNASENDGLIVFSTVLGSSDSAERTLYLPNAIQSPTGKVYYIKNIVGNNTTLRVANNGYIIGPGTSDESQSYGIGNKSAFVINEGSSWVVFYCG